ncbi:MAG: hypothetical protein U0R78_19865 [Nocardioidaceae bacterium]
MSSRVRALIASAITMLVVAGCAAPSPDKQPNGDPLETPASSQATSSSGPTTLFNEPWLVEEGVWWITTHPDTYPPSRGAFAGQRNGLLGAKRPGTLWLFLPALYGKYHLRMELLNSPPPVSGRFKDVVEVSFRSSGSLEMGSFETFATSMPVPAGTYRVRLSATDLDRTQRETNRGEFRRGGYKTYRGLILLQLWPAPARHDAVLREGTRFAHRAHHDLPSGEYP